MRKKAPLKISLGSVSIFVLFLFSFLLSSIPALAQEEGELTISIFDPPSSTIPLDEDEPIFLEGREYGILVGYVTVDQDGEVIDRGIAHDATVSVPWASYVTSATMPQITITAPSFEEYDVFIIEATKEGYKSAGTLIAVIKGELRVFLDRGVAQEGETFQVTVKDQDNDGVQGCTVYMDNYESDSDTTNSNGVAYLKAPKVDGDVEITIITFKGGYDVVSTNLLVEDFNLLMMFGEFLPIILAGMCVIIAIIIVTIRKRLSRPRPSIASNIPKNDEIYFKEKKLNERKDPIELEPPERELELPPLEREPKIEEIRIHRSTKKKSTTNVPDKESSRKVIPLESGKDDYRWFEGTDNIRDKIDKLTVDVDERKKDKWFEGTDDIRSKIDETLAKKQKKKRK